MARPDLPTEWTNWALSRAEGSDASWRSEAACRGMDPNLFFATRLDGPGVTAYAKRVCGECPVQDQCLRYALTSGERHGIWGQADEKQRARMGRATDRRRRGAA